MKISAYIIGFNEECNIKDAVNSVLWADEVVFVDSFSTDRSAEIAESLGARVIQVPFEGFGRLRSSAIASTLHEWVFSLDTDERCTEAARDEILAIVRRPDASDAYFVPRKNRFMGRWINHCGWYPDYRQPQLFRRDALQFNDDMVHEGYTLLGSAGYMKNYILQEPYRDIAHMRHKLLRYSELGAEKLKKQQKPSSVSKGLMHAVAAFTRIWIIKKGFLDGWPGFIIALANFEYTFYKYVIRAEQLRQERTSAPT